MVISCHRLLHRFRSDPLDEIVGLDTSYHGGALLGSSSVNPEYISAYKQRKQEKKERRISGRGSSNFMDASWVSGDFIEGATDKEEDAIDEAVNSEEDDEVVHSDYDEDETGA